MYFCLASLQVSRAMAYEEKGFQITTSAVPEVGDSSSGVLESPQNADGNSSSPAKKAAAADDFLCFILHPSIGSLRKLPLSLHPSVGNFKRHGFPSGTDVPKWRNSSKHDGHRHTSYAMRQALRSSSMRCGASRKP